MSYDRLAKCGIVPVVKIDRAENAAPLAKALLAGGIDAIEITFRTAAAPDAIRAVRAACPEMYAGAGTVINAGQVQAAKDAGAEFIVSPGLDADVVNAAKALGLTVIPGVVTPTEIIAALKLGLDVLKFFPAENYGGLKTLKALSAPFGQVKFVPTGGINEKNVREYLAFGKVLAVGGSWMVKEDLGEAERLSAEAVKILREVRG